MEAGGNSGWGEGHWRWGMGREGRRAEQGLRKEEAWPAGCRVGRQSPAGQRAEQTDGGRADWQGSDGWRVGVGGVQRVPGGAEELSEDRASWQRWAAGRRPRLPRVAGLPAGWQHSAATRELHLPWVAEQPAGGQAGWQRSAAWWRLRGREEGEEDMRTG